MMNAREIRWAPWIIFSATVLGAAFCAVRLEAQPALPSARANPTALTQSAPATLGRNKAPFDAASADAAGYQALDAKRIDDAEVRFKAVLGARPQDADALAGMGLVRMQQGNFLGAVSFLEQAKQANPNDKTIADALDNARFSFLAGEGSAALAANDLGTAERRYREALELRPGSADALRGMVATLLAGKKLDDAQELLEKSLTQQAAAGVGPAAGVELLLADLYLERGQPQLAYPVYRQVIHQDKQNADAWAGVLTTLHLTGHDADVTAETMRIPPAIRAQLQANPSYAQMMGVAQITGPPAGLVTPNSAQQTQLPADVEVQNARQLLNSTDETGLYSDLMQLGARVDLSDVQRRAVQMIWVEWAVRRARQALAAGDAQRATNLLDAAARSSPDDAAVAASAAQPSVGSPQQLSTLLDPGSGAASSVAARPAAPNASAQSPAQNAATSVLSPPQSAAQSGETYQPYVTYIAPPPAPVRAPAAPVVAAAQPSNSAATPASVVGLPSVSNAGRSTKGPARTAQREQTVEPARSARPSAKSETTGAPQVTQPAAQPASRGSDVPDTGDQQYPQPPKPPKP